MTSKAEVTLGSLGSYINGRGFKPVEWGTTGLPIVRIANLSTAHAPHDYYDGPLDPGHWIDTGDMLVSWSATLDASIWNRGPAALNQHIFKVLPNEELVTPEYLYFVLKQAITGLTERVHGATMKHVTRPEFEGFKVVIDSCRERQSRIAARLKAQLAEVETARQSVKAQLREATNLANAIVLDSVRNTSTESHSLGEVLNEIKQGIGQGWEAYPVLGATRDGLAPAKEQPGKQALKYKPAFPGAVFYNPMRILIGSIAYVGEEDTPGITSPDYVVLQGKSGIVDSRWFYYWLRSPLGVQCIASLARGAVRERMLFNRLAEGKIELPKFGVQEKASQALKELKPLRRAIENKLAEINLMPQKILTQAFEQQGD